MANLLGKRTTLKQCGVCGKSGCTGWSTGLISCTTHRDGTKGELLNGFEFIKQDRVGLGLWKPHSPADKGDHNIDPSVIAKGSKARLAALKPVVKISQAKPLIDLNKRNSQLRAWAFDKGLSPESEARLIARGISPEQIEAAVLSGLFWDVHWGDNPAHGHLPGKWGDKGYAGAVGMAIACQQYRMSKDGRLEPIILGAQIQTDAAFKAKGGSKYLWMSKDGNAQISQWNNENPITVHLTGNDADFAVITEGILKPWLTLQRAENHGIDLGKAVIGTAGSAWASSSFTQIKEQLKLLGVSKLRLALDAGAPQNNVVMMGASALAMACHRAGIELKVIWYSQFEKADGDIDEINVPRFYELLSVGEIERLEKKRVAALPAAERPEPQKKAPAKKQPLTATRGFQEDYGYLPNQADELTDLIITHRATWLRSPKSTGKSQLIKRLAERLQEAEIPVIMLTSRISLADALGALASLPVKNEVVEYGEHLGFVITADSCHPTSGMRFSAANLPSEYFVIIDEADAFIDHVCFGGTAIKNHRNDVVHEISATIANAMGSLFCSADLNDEHAYLIEKACGISGDRTLKIVNDYQPELASVSMYGSAAEVIWRGIESLKAGKSVAFKLTGQLDSSTYGTQAIENVIKGEIEGCKTARFDGKTLADPSNALTHIEISTEFGPPRVEGVLSYLNHPNQATRLKRQKEYFGALDAFVYNNVCGTGVSFESDSFDELFIVETGVCSADDSRQGLMRIRKPIPRHVYVAPTSINRFGNGATSPNELEAGSNSEYSKALSLLRSVECDWLPEQPHERMSAVSHAWVNYSLIRSAQLNEQGYRLSEAFREGLEDEGYEVKDGFTASWMLLSDKEKSAFIDEIKAYRDGVFTKNNTETSAVDVEGIELKKLSKQRKRTPKQNSQLLKLTIMQGYGVTEEGVSEDLIAEHKKGLYPKLLRRFALEQGSNAIAHRDKAVLSKMLDKGLPWSGDLTKKMLSTEVQLYEELHIPELLDYLQGKDDEGRPHAIHQAHPLVQKVLEAAAERHKEIKQLTRIVVGDIATTDEEDGSVTTEIQVRSPIKTIQSLLKRLHLNVKATGRIRIDGEQTRSFTFIDKLISNESKKSVVDYDRFTAAQLEKNQELISGTRLTPIRATELRKKEQLSTQKIASEYSNVKNGKNPNLSVLSADLAEYSNAYKSYIKASEYSADAENPEPIAIKNPHPEFNPFSSGAGVAESAEKDENTCPVLPEKLRDDYYNVSAWR